MTGPVSATAPPTALQQNEPELPERLNPVLAASGGRREYISEIEAPLARYPRLANLFRRIPIVASRRPAMRVVYSAGRAS